MSTSPSDELRRVQESMRALELLEDNPGMSSEVARGQAALEREQADTAPDAAAGLGAPSADLRDLTREVARLRIVIERATVPTLATLAATLAGSFEAEWSAEDLVALSSEILGAANAWGNPTEKS